MAGKFTLYVKQKGGSAELCQKAITLLKTYVASVVAKSTNFDSSDAVLVDDTTTPTLLDTDVIVYVVSRLSKSVISAQGGSVAMAEANDKVLGLTDLNRKISEVYFDRVYPDSSKELSGACFHEAAHIKSNTGNSMHDKQDGFLKASPDYNGTPTDLNISFMAKHLDTKVSMKGSY